MNKKWISALLVLTCAALIGGCNDDDKECDVNDAAYCSADGSSMMVCSGGTWMPVRCHGNSVCAYSGGATVCAAVSSRPAGPACTPNESKCADTRLSASCTAEGKWKYTVCGLSQECRSGKCTDLPDPVEPTPTGILSTACGIDGRSVVTTYADGKTSQKSCLELTGYDAPCRTYKDGFAGCEMPEKCGSVFSENGTCIGDRRMYCDMKYIVPKAAQEDCAALGKVCGTADGYAGCYKSCSVDSDAEAACTPEGLVSKCVKSDDSKDVMLTGTSICTDDMTSISCKDGTVITHHCKSDEICSSLTGTCLEMCTASDINDVKCDENGRMTMCQAAGDRHLYVGVGKNHCIDDLLVRCVKDEASGGFKVKETNCLEYVHTDGKKYKAHCVTDMNYIPDADVCMPVSEGAPCGGVTENGTCSGSTLSFCLTQDNVLSVSDCSGNAESGRTECSVYAGYADCRKPCSGKGEAVCTAGQQEGEPYHISVCVPDDNTGALTFVDGTSVCLGNDLYTCDENGRTSVFNCASNGGICHINACRYPSCGIDTKPQCMSDDSILACQVEATGNVLGMSLQTIYCTPDGKCSHCSGGSIVTE